MLLNNESEKVSKKALRCNMFCDVDADTNYNTAACVRVHARVSVSVGR